MKKLIIALLLPLMAQYARAQDVDINILTIPPTLEQNTSGVILVTLCNGDASMLDAPANKLRPLISVNPIVEITGVTNTDGSPLTGWTVLTQSATSVRLQNTVPLVNGECASFHVQIKALTVSGLKVITGTLAFNGPQTDGNNTANDNSTTAIAVTPPLPVTLTRIAASRENSTTLLSWTTTEETNSDRFEIERSTGGKNWTNIGAVKSTGESNALKNYSFVDKTPVHGENLYRLKMIDKDMTFAYSRMVSVKFDGLVPNGAELVSVYPNPASDLIFLKEIDLKNIEKVAIVDLMGRTVYSSKSVGIEGINISNLSSGMYLLHVTAVDGVVSNRKIVVRK